MPYFRQGPIEWVLTAILLIGLLLILWQPAYAWIPLIVMAYAVGFYTGRRAWERTPRPD